MNQNKTNPGGGEFFHAPTPQVKKQVSSITTTSTSKTIPTTRIPHPPMYV